MADDATNDGERMLEFLLEKGVIKRGAVLVEQPPELPHTAETWGRVEGMLLCAAIGDSLGAPTETYLPEQRRAAIGGDVTDYAEVSGSNVNIGLPTDDTQLTYWTLEQLIEDKRFIGPNVGRRLAEHTRGGGSTSAGFARNFNALTDEDMAAGEWMRCGVDGASNGALMRISPVVVPHLKHPTRQLWTDAAAISGMTHTNSMSVATCVAFTKILWGLLGASAPPRPGWFVDTFSDAASQLETVAYEPRGGNFVSDGKVQLHDYVRRHVGEAIQTGKSMSAVEACTTWHSGAFLMETVPCVLVILEKHAANLEQAIVRAASDTKDNDTVASIVGACVGALHGTSRVPQRWITNLLGRTSAQDDGRVFQDIDDARSVFWE